MSVNQASIDAEALLAHLTGRGFGDIALRRNAALRPHSEAWMEGAGNLIDKALAALRRGDPERARGLVDRAVALPYDEFERSHPAAWQAHMALFVAVTDRVETGDGEDWLDAVLEVMRRAPHHGRCTLRDCLDSMTGDWELLPAQLDRVRAGVRDVPARPPLLDLEGTPAELSEAVLGTLEALIAFEDALP